jgi:restriction system protein
MTETEGVFWGIHTKGADGDELYLRKKFIAIGWHEVGDLTKLSPDRETFKATLA